MRKSKKNYYITQDDIILAKPLSGRIKGIRYAPKYARITEYDYSSEHYMLMTVGAEMCIPKHLFDKKYEIIYKPTSSQLEDWASIEKLMSKTYEELQDMFRGLDLK